MWWKVLILLVVIASCSAQTLVPCNLKDRDRYSFVVCDYVKGQRGNCLCGNP